MHNAYALPVPDENGGSASHDMMIIATDDGKVWWCLADELADSFEPVAERDEEMPPGKLTLFRNLSDRHLQGIAWIHVPSDSNGVFTLGQDGSIDDRASDEPIWELDPQVQSVRTHWFPMDPYILDCGDGPTVAWNAIAVADGFACP